MNELERINSAIAYELDKYQVILEYGRVMLGASDDVKRKYYWAMIPNWAIVTSVVADIISAMVGSIANLYKKSELYASFIKKLRPQPYIALRLSCSTHFFQ